MSGLHLVSPAYSYNPTLNAHRFTFQVLGFPDGFSVGGTETEHITV